MNGGVRRPAGVLGRAHANEEFYDSFPVWGLIRNFATASGCSATAKKQARKNISFQL